jgi:3-oxoadipate enol-lactonase
MQIRRFFTALVMGLAMIASSSVAGASTVTPPFPQTYNTQDMGLVDHTTRIVDTGGEGTPVVLIHGLAADHQMWTEVVKQLAKHHRVIAYDVRGHGRAAGAPKPFTVPVFAADLAALMDKLGIRQAHVYGMSMGGAIAQQFAIDHPERVRSLALIATFSRAQPAFVLRGESGVKDGMPAQIVPTLTRWFTPAALAENGSGVRYARESVLDTRPDDWLASWTALATVDVFPHLGSIKAPTKVIAGELDVSCPPELMRNDIASQIPNARFHVVPRASHMITLSSPVELAKVLSAQD